MLAGVLSRNLSAGSLFLGCVTLVRGGAGYSHQTFPWTICRSVGMSVRLSSALWKNGGSDPDAVWHHKSDGSRVEAGSAVWGSAHGKGYFWGEFGARHCNQWRLHGVRVRQCLNRRSCCLEWCVRWAEHCCITWGPHRAREGEVLGVFVPHCHNGKCH